MTLRVSRTIFARRKTMSEVITTNLGSDMSQVHNVIRFIKALSYIARPHGPGVFTEIAEITSFDHAITVSWSQGGEDLALLHATMGK